MWGTILTKYITAPPTMMLAHEEAKHDGAQWAGGGIPIGLPETSGLHGQKGTETKINRVTNRLHGTNNFAMVFFFVATAQSTLGAWKQAGSRFV
jgi:hypothetical protein